LLPSRSTSRGFAISSNHPLIRTVVNASSQAQRQQLWMAKAIQHTGGRWIIGLVGMAVVVCGLVLVMEGLPCKLRSTRK
jgi:hypothetical protein